MELTQNQLNIDRLTCNSWIQPACTNSNSLHTRSLGSGIILFYFLL
uniref:Uncharacterized protein n=1 Tax=Rhizophora mucronata TaxID=61149 RepID=A0A2P2NZ22_RHIMU